MNDKELRAIGLTNVRDLRRWAKRKRCVHPLKAITVFHWNTGCGFICEMCLTKVDFPPCRRPEKHEELR